ncbi:TAFII28-domain-containing protein [Lepidopterella palustris CBS 459.81]|uniref:TAFII28-domain-containing protein n=1 Tax=Lepidopterella palustris CBS 459.81 TaxID=1314670 RepID=A0A8E2EI45_9PEZI|nr:TAFII28-domain-containing protein [Lepidopterella palustris CBS 459.81]
MASPPPIPTINIHGKRASIASTTSTTQKRRKQSGLRNPYVPDPASTSAAGTPRSPRSPSVESSVAGTTITNNNGAGKGRRRKGEDARSMTGTSVRGGKEGSRSVVVGEGEGEGEGGDMDDDEEEEGGEGVEMTVEGGPGDEAAEMQNKEKMKVLLEALSEDQAERYEIYRRIKLKKDIVRKITNQTLSQSVPQPVIVTINGYTKVFIGELITHALTIRDEHALSRTHLPNPSLPPQLLSTALQKPSSHRPDAKLQPADFMNMPSLALRGREAGLWVEVGEGKTLKERLAEEDKGPLTPDHLREALTRYRRDREGGGAGFGGLSLEGKERAAVRAGGRRLFR